MSTLIFLGTLLSLVILIIGLLIKTIKRKPIIPRIKTIGIIFFSYLGLWFVFFVLSKDIIIPLGTDICFDDWCITVTKADQSADSIHKSQLIFLQVRMSNHARGIAQKPSEPRIHIIDDSGGYWPASQETQALLEQRIGKQIPLDTRLELHQALETKIAFQIPIDRKNLKILIEEGPFIGKLLFYEDRKLFQVN